MEDEANPNPQHAGLFWTKNIVIVGSLYTLKCQSVQFGWFCKSEHAEGAPEFWKIIKNGTYKYILRWGSLYIFPTFWLKMALCEMQAKIKNSCF